MLEYHTIDDKGTIETRTLFEDYNLIGTPSVVFNGLRGAGIIMGPCPPATYREKIDFFRGQTSTVMMSVRNANPGELSASVDITNLSTIGLGNAKLYAVIFEDLNVSQNRYVVRDITPLQTVTMPGHGSASFEIKTGQSATTSRHMAVILKSTTGTILQSQFVM